SWCRGRPGVGIDSASSRKVRLDPWWGGVVMSRLCLVAVACGLVASLPRAHAQKEFGFDNRKPSGQPYWPADKSLAGFKVPAGWEVKLVAAEPDVINPVAFSIDERGRIWVLQCFEYPKRTPKGKKPADRLKIIEEEPN